MRGVAGSLKPHDIDVGIPAVRRGQLAADHAVYAATVVPCGMNRMTIGVEKEGGDE